VTTLFDQNGTSIKCFTYVGVAPVPALTSTPSGDAVTRNVFVTLLSDIVPATRRPYLRQRQSPLWVPSRNSDAYLLRNNQTPYL